MSQPSGARRQAVQTVPREIADQDDRRTIGSSAGPAVTRPEVTFRPQKTTAAIMDRDEVRTSGPALGDARQEARRTTPADDRGNDDAGVICQGCHTRGSRRAARASRSCRAPQPSRRPPGRPRNIAASDRRHRDGLLRAEGQLTGKRRSNQRQHGPEHDTRSDLDSLLRARSAERELDRDSRIGGNTRVATTSAIAPKSHDSGDVCLKGCRHRCPVSSWPPLSETLPPWVSQGNGSNVLEASERSSASECDHGDARERDHDSRDSAFIGWSYQPLMTDSGFTLDPPSRPSCS